MEQKSLRICFLVFLGGQKKISIFLKILIFLGHPLKKSFFLPPKNTKKTYSETFLRCTLFLFGPLLPKYPHFLALKAHISEMRAEIEKVTVACALYFHFALFRMYFKFFFCNLKFSILTPASEITL